MRKLLPVCARWALCVFVVNCGLAVSAQDVPASAEPDIVESIDASEGTASQDDGGETVTESIVTESITGESSGMEPSAAPPTAAETEETTRTKVSGWARESLEFYPYDRGLRRGSGDAFGVPRDRLISRTQFLVRANYQRGKWFEAAVSGNLGVNVHVEGTGKDLGFHGWGSQGTVELLDASLRELYLGFYASKFDLRIGQQRVAWGVADILSPNDVVNARDARDPFLNEPELNRVPTPLVRGTGYWGPATFELLFSPVFVPDRSSLYGRNWAAIQPDAPAEYRGLFALTTRAVDPSIQDKVTEAIYQTQLPNKNGRGLSLGAKLGIHTSALDLNFYYHYGYDGTPYFWLNPALAGVLKSTDFTRAGFQDLAPLLRAIDQGLVPIFAEYVRRHHAGFDAVAAAGPFVLRLDAAFQSQRVFYRADLTSISSPTALAVLSLDYQTGSVDKLLVVEGVYIRVLEQLHAPLLAYKQDSYGFALAFRWPLFSVFAAEVRGMAGISPRFYMAQPALVIKATSGLAIKLGGMILNGERNSFGRYYRDNASLFLQLRYGF